jgi:hypothetical protein
MSEEEDVAEGVIDTCKISQIKLCSHTLGLCSLSTFVACDEVAGVC